MNLIPRSKVFVPVSQGRDPVQDVSLGVQGAQGHLKVVVQPHTLFYALQTLLLHVQQRVVGDAVHVLLVSDLTQCSSGDPLGLLDFFVLIYLERVHLARKGREFGHHFALGLVLELARHLRILYTLVKPFGEFGQVVQITVCPLDMHNAFNLVSHQALVDLCAVHFPELLPYVSWCYSNHQHLWHNMEEPYVGLRSAARRPSTFPP